MKRHLLLLICVLSAAVGCSRKDTDQPLRPEYIKVYETSADKTVDDIQIPFDGVQDGKIHILSNVDLQWKYLVNPASSAADWFTIKSVIETEPGHIVVTYDAESLLPLNSLERREGRISFVCPSASIGKFISVRQGYENRFFDDFAGEDDGTLKFTGMQSFTTDEKQMLNKDYFDYISFNAWAETTDEFLSKNITVDVTVSGGVFYATGLTTYRVNVPIGTGADKSNLRYLLVAGKGERMSTNTKFTFSVENDAQVIVHIDNFAGYKVAESEWSDLFDDDDFEEEAEDWI